MSDNFRGRRRIPATPSTRRTPPGNNNLNPWLITIVAAIVVIAGGWFLGQALARVFNGPHRSHVAQGPSAQPALSPAPSPSVSAASPSSSPSPKPTRTPKPKPKPKPTPTAAPVLSPTPSAIITPAPSTPPTPVAKPTTAATTSAPATPAPAKTSAPIPSAAPESSGQSAAAEHVVRAYIDAIRSGDPQGAATYLGNGVPDESFIDSGTRITSVTSTPNADGSYKVEADLQTSKGEYFETFTVASGRILDKTAIKV